MSNKNRQTKTHKKKQGPKFSMFEISVITTILIVGVLAPLIKGGSIRWLVRDLPEETLVSTVPETSAPLPAGVHEQAKFVVEDDVVYVNNTICAYSGSQMKQEDLGVFTSRVVYDGPDPTFKGKTLVFNQCCQMCERGFPQKWQKEQDRIMRTHGLVF